MALHPQTNGGRMLKRGDSSDIECWRTTHRLRVGQGILRSLGIEQTWTHLEMDGKSPETWPGGPKHQCNYRCTCEWPEWVTGEMFDLAYRLACEVQTERGAYERAAAGRARSRVSA